jgi:predicted RNA-binding protein with PUA-like domain
MNYWLVKSEPEEFSFQNLMEEGKTTWDGVRNYAARNNLRAMKKDDLVLFYHSMNEKQVVGICKVIKEFYPDPTTTQGDWSVVDLAPVKPIEKPVHLKTIKTIPRLENIGLVKIGRLSVMPLTEGEFNIIIELGETDLKQFKKLE